MKAKTFESLIRKVVREEIDYALRREIQSLKEDLIGENQPLIEETKPHARINPSLKEEIINSPKLKKHKKINFGVGGTLEELLNETAQGDTNLDNPSSPVSMEGDFSTIGGMPTEAAPKVVQEAVNRDYSDLMKAIDKKRNK